LKTKDGTADLLRAEVVGRHLVDYFASILAWTNVIKSD
jgi:hypothetical protein